MFKHLNNMEEIINKHKEASAILDTLLVYKNENELTLKLKMSYYKILQEILSTLEIEGYTRDQLKEILKVEENENKAN